MAPGKPEREHTRYTRSTRSRSPGAGRFSREVPLSPTITYTYFPRDKAPSTDFLNGGIFGGISGLIWPLGTALGHGKKGWLCTQS